MANIIAYNLVDEQSFCKLSNGETAVMIALLVLAGSHLAEAPHEKDLVTWLASRDQGVVGLRVVGFDMSELPWAKDEPTFSNQQLFLTVLFERVRNKIDCDLLDCTPSSVDDNLDKLASLVQSFQFDLISAEPSEWWHEPQEPLQKCKFRDV